MTTGPRGTLGALGVVALLVLIPSRAMAGPAPQLSGVVIPNLGAGYAVVSQGQLNAGQFASSSPDPSAAARALGTLASSVKTYERVWQDSTALNEVQDLVVQLPSDRAAQAFVEAAQHSLSSGEIVSAKPLAEIPGAMRTTYFATTTRVGVGQAITLRRGPYVVLLSIFSAGANNPQPITDADAVMIARAQDTAVAKALAHNQRPRRDPTSHSTLGTAFVIAIVLAAALVVLVWWQRRAATRRSRVQEPRAPEPTS
jgi:hypothetical protein